MSSRQQLENMTKSELIVEAKRLGRTGYSGKKNAEIVDLILNPSSVQKSPGRPKGTGKAQTQAKAEKGKGPGRPKQAPSSKSKTVEYSQVVLNYLTLPHLKTLAQLKAVQGYSGKNKNDIIVLLLAKPHREHLTLSTVKDGATSTVTVVPTELSRLVPEMQTAGAAHSSPRGAQRQELRIAGQIAPMTTLGSGSVSSSSMIQMPAMTSTTARLSPRSQQVQYRQ